MDNLSESDPRYEISLGEISYVLNCVLSLECIPSHFPQFSVLPQFLLLFQFFWYFLANYSVFLFSVLSVSK